MQKLIRPAPPNWWHDFAAKGEAELREIMFADPSGAEPVSYLKRTRFYRSGRVRELKAIFAESSKGSCHVCGMDVTAVSSGDLEHYRPKSNASNLRKDRSTPRHYWWLLYEWTNYQLLCAICNRYKASLFPVRSKRAAEGCLGADLDDEGPLLLNPFDDDPRDHLRLLDSGVLVPDSDRGKTTIEVYSLNRLALISNRKELYRRFLQLADLQDRAQELGDQATADEIGTSLQGLAPFHAFVIDTLRQARDLPSSGTKTSQKLAFQKLATVRQATAAAKTVPRKFETTWIRSVHLRDFGPIGDLKLTFPDPHAGQEPWIGIVGENGVGKSTFLKAVALALVDNKTAINFVPDASRLHNRNSRTRKGHVEVALSDGRKRRVAFRSNSRHFEFFGEEVQLPVIALGASRITSGKGAASKLPIAGAVDNLFDPVLPLSDAESWLANTKLVSARDFAVLGRNLKALMGLPIEIEVSRRSGVIYFKRRNSRQSLDQMSDGFRSVVGLTTHIMKYLTADTPIMSEAEGTVLLDELELHLHPVWKKRIVARLRELFPRVRFIITTHDPLCLRGLEKDESFVLRRNPDSDEIESQALAIRPGMNVDDLLTGGWFGLGTTYDEETEDMLHELSALSLREDALKLLPDTDLPESERDHIDALSHELQQRLHGFGASAFERQSLIDIARSRIDVPDILEVDADALQARLKQAFGQSE